MKLHLLQHELQGKNMRILKTTVLVLSAIAGIATTTASLAVTASATAGGFTFSVYDLNPEDHISPSFAFLSSQSFQLVAARIGTNGVYVRDEGYKNSAAVTTVDGEVKAFGPNVGALSDLSVTATIASGGASEHAYAASSYHSIIRLSAGSGLKVSYRGNIRVNGWTTGDSAFAQTLAGAQDVSNKSWYVANYVTSAVAFGDGNGEYDFESSFSYENAGSEAIEFDQVSSVALQLLTVPAVPEPETYALMLTGVGLVGALARRRKTRYASGQDTLTSLRD